MLASGLLNAQPDKTQRLLKIAADSTDRLVRLINDILDVERIESGKVKMAKQACNLAEIMIQAANTMQAMADKAGVMLSVSTLSAQVWADPDRIIQTFTNLLSNAIKFSYPGGTVWLTAELLGQASGLSSQQSAVSAQALEASYQPTLQAGQSATIVDYPSGSEKEISKLSPKSPIPNLKSLPPAAYVLFTVRDQGRGIPTDKLDTIFERFQQVDSSDSRDHEGTGLGLAICRSIVQQHDGQIEVESRLGEGSTFYFTLPLSGKSTRMNNGE